MATETSGTFDWSDPLSIEGQLGEDERLIRDAANAYAQGELLPRIVDAYAREITDPAIFQEMGELGLLGPTLPEELGGSGASHVAYGLIAREIERVDSGCRSLMFSSFGQNWSTTMARFAGLSWKKACRVWKLPKLTASCRYALL